MDVMMGLYERRRRERKRKRGDRKRVWKRRDFFERQEERHTHTKNSI
jgi:hypothetical protein